MRKPHAKTRTGCLQCRHRRVKCDEGKPACSYCARYSRACNYTAAAATPSTSLPLSLSPSTSSDSHGTTLDSSVSAITTFLSHSLANEPPDTSYVYSSDLDMKALELLYHYTAQTYLTLTRNESQVELWRVTAPNLAFKSRFLMRSLLAISALHLCHLQPIRHEELTHAAAFHMNLALGYFRSDVTDMTKQNFETVCAFSCFVSIYGMASWQSADRRLRSSPTSTNKPLHDFLERLHLIRSTFFLLSSKADWANTGAMAPLAHTNLSVNFATNPDDHRIAALLQLVTPPDSASPARKEQYRVYRHALDRLRITCALCTSTENSFNNAAPVNIWISSISEEFVQLLYEGQPEALVLLAHLCVVLKQVGRFWFMHACPERLVTTIADMLSHEWRTWIEWPLREIVGRCLCPPELEGRTLPIPIRC